MRLGTLFFCLVSLVLMASAALAQPNDSPCNQGRAKPPRIDPRYDWLICMPELARHRGVIDRCIDATTYEWYGQQLYPVSKVPGRLSWIVNHVRCNAVPLSEELLLYRENAGAIPDKMQGERIGPREVLSNTRLLATGDWDGSGTVDLCCYIEIYGDSSAGPNPEGYEYGYSVVFWSDSLGRYSIDDTTQLSCDSDRWGGVQGALGTDRNNDGIDDLFIVDFGVGFTAGGISRHAQGMTFLGGAGKRWGHGGASRSADWRWWNTPSLYSFMKEIDQDGDGNMDVAWFGQSRHPYVKLTVWYGNAMQGIPDTTAIESVDLTNTNGHAANYIDISNDGLPELIVNCGSEEQLAVFVGLRGQRLVEQYGPGHERFDTTRGERWWTKPFARVWLPARINNAWPQSTWNVVYDLGDANNDGYRDIWIHAKPFLLCYTSGPALDSLVDALMDLSPYGVTTQLHTLGSLGTYGTVFGIGTTDGVIYARPDNEIPARSSRVRRWPDGTLGPKMQADDEHAEEHSTALHLEAIPNPSAGTVQLQWMNGAGAVELFITDLVGRDLLHTQLPAGTHTYRFDRAGFTPGVYLVTIRAVNRSGVHRTGTVTVVLY